MNSLNAPTGEYYCVFLTGGVWFAIPAKVIREVAGRPTLATVPRSDPVLAGICHEGGEFIPVLRLPSRAGADLNRPSRESDEQMLVLYGPNGAWGLLIDQVHGIESLECLQDAEGYCDDWSTAVMGTSTLKDQKDQVVRILNPDGLYRLAEQMLKRDWTDLSPSTLAPI